MPEENAGRDAHELALLPLNARHTYGTLNGLISSCHKMMYTFKSCFASQIEDFIAQKNALGFGYLESSRLLRDFDRFCLTHFPEENTLTKELCLAWATKKDTEGNNTFRNRMMPVREFARYLNRNGEAAYILPPDIARKDAPYAPYIYTEAEILAIWDVFDHLKPRGGFPVRQFVIPAMIKLMYCCGLRPSEARRLHVDDVDLDIGRLNIMESKQHRSRIVMMADDVTKMLSDCNAVVTSAMPEREPFFPNSEGGFYGKRGLEKTFRLVLKKAGVTGTGRRSPRLYDFRHTFATHRLYHWMNEGKDLNVMIPYLSAYMGHAQLSDTYYYIHLVPGLLEEMSGFTFSSAEAFLPEVGNDE